MFRKKEGMKRSEQRFRQTWKPRRLQTSSQEIELFDKTIRTP